MFASQDLKTRRFHESYRLISEIERYRLLPLKVIRVKITYSENKNRYLYVFQLDFGVHWFIDDATDFSGTGSRIRDDLESYLRGLKERGVPVFDFVIDAELYELLKFIFYADARALCGGEDYGY